METEHWCSRGTEAYYSRLLSRLRAFMGRECYLRTLFIHPESWRPWPFIMELLLILAGLGTADHSLLPEILSLLGFFDAAPF